MLVDGVNTLEADVGALAKKAGYVYQDFENQIVRPTVLDDASYACLNYAMGDYEKRGKEALSLCGLEGREQDYVWSLSGGQTHLLALAGAVSLGPEVLILDEPIAQLDPGHADRIYGVLKELNEKHGKTILVIEHHTEYIADYCKHVVLMRDGKIAWKLPANEALRRVGELRESNIFPPQVTLARRRAAAQGRPPLGAGAAHHGGGGKGGLLPPLLPGKSGAARSRPPPRGGTRRGIPGGVGLLPLGQRGAPENLCGAGSDHPPGG